MRIASRLIAASVIAATVAFMTVAKVPWDTALGRAAQDASHVLASGVIALASLWLIRSVSAAARDSDTVALLSAFTATCLAGVGVELAQGLSGLDAEGVDIVRNAAGAAAFLLIAFAVGGRRSPARPRRWQRVGALVIAGALWLGAWADLAAWATATLDRDRSFPILCRFDRPEHIRFASANGAHLDIVAPPADWSAAAGHRVGRLELGAGRDPGLGFDEPYPDWRGYRTLVIGAWNPEREPLSLALRIHDDRHDGRYADRFNRSLTFPPGASRIRIPLAEVERAPAGRAMDLGRIAGVILFEPGEDRPRTLYLDSIFLE